MVMDRHRVQRSVFLFHIQFRVTCTIMYKPFVYFTKKKMQSTRVSKLCHCAKNCLQYEYVAQTWQTPDDKRTAHAKKANVTGVICALSGAAESYTL